MEVESGAAGPDLAPGAPRVPASHSRPPLRTLAAGARDRRAPGRDIVGHRDADCRRMVVYDASRGMRRLVTVSILLLAVSACADDSVSSPPAISPHHRAAPAPTSIEPSTDVPIGAPAPPGGESATFCAEMCSPGSESCLRQGFARGPGKLEPSDVASCAADVIGPLGVWCGLMQVRCEKICGPDGVLGFAAANPSGPLPRSYLHHCDTVTAARYEKSCDGGEPRACANLGVRYENGSGVSKDETRAAALYKQSCDHGYAHGCSNLGSMYKHGTGVGKDEVRAVTLYKRSCDGGDGGGCSNLGLMYERVSGVPKDATRAAALYKRACDGGDARGCSNLGLMYYHGTGVQLDEARAAALFKRSCDGGDDRGCEELKRLVESP